MNRLQRFKRKQELNEHGINMVDLMMWLVIAALLLAAAIQGIGYYQKAAYLYQMKEAVGVAAGRITAAAATEGTVITEEVIERVVAEENAERPNDHIVLTAGSLASYASGGTGLGAYGFDRASVVAATSGGMSNYVKATHDAVSDREAAYFFKATASYKDGVNMVNTGILEAPIGTPEGSPTGTPTTPVVVAPDFSKDPVWTQQAGVGTNVWYGVTISADGQKMATAPSIHAPIAGSNGGRIKTSTDGGVNWTEQANSPYANWRGLDSSADGNILIAGAFDNPGAGTPYTASDSYTGYVHISRDAGATWTQTTLPSGRWYGTSVSADGQHMLAVDASTVTGTRGGYPWVSHDSGATWTKVTNVNGTADSGKGVWFGSVISNDGQKLLASKYNGYVYSSSNGGASWTEHTAAGPQNWARFAASEDGSTIIATTLKTVSTTHGKLFISKDSGATFTEAGDAGSGNWTGAAISSDGTKIVAGKVANSVSGGELKLSVDGGVTWKIQSSVPTNGTWYNAAMTPDGTKMIAGNSVAGQTIYTGIVK